MGWEQLITPDPDIPCEPGMCLQYVRQAFGRPVVEPTAAAAWAAAQYKHTDQDFPEGVWVPLWFAIPGVPAGHVVLRAPDGSIYSTSDDSETPHHHPSLEDLIWYYGPRVQPQYQLELQYLGWSEDISGASVITTTTIETEDTMALTNEDLDNIYQRVWFGGSGLPLIQNRRTGQGAWPETFLGSLEARVQNEILAPALAALPAADIAALVPEELIQAVADGLSARLTAKPAT